MNTQAHLLVAAAIFCRSNSHARTGRASVVPGNVAVIVGALIPDASLFVMWAAAKLRGIGDDVIWQQLYYSDYWQYIGAVTNSIPVYLALALLGWILCKRTYPNVSAIVGQQSKKSHWPAVLQLLACSLYLFAAAALLHCVGDLPLHADDGHPHFWPITFWIYSSPVSYWDPQYYGLYWVVIEFSIALVCVWILFRRFQSVSVKVCTILLLLLYPIAFAFWSWTMA